MGCGSPNERKIFHTSGVDAKTETQQFQWVASWHNARKIGRCRDDFLNYFQQDQQIKE